MSNEDLGYRVTENIAHFIINREPQRNALNLATISLFLKHLDQAECDDTARAVLITGAGDRAFCSGADLGSAAKNRIQEGFRDYARLLKKLAGYPKPVVARINGDCLAGGMGLMLACDIVIARNDVKFGTPEVNVGLFPMMIGALIYRNVLRKKAMEMVLLGHKLDAGQARDMGLITRAVEPQKLDAEVSMTLKLLAAKSPIGIRLGKEAFYAMADMPFEDALDFLSQKIVEVAATEDAREGITAFLEKRPPVFKGK
ncbi:MAG: enoyl-CoA hydratase-related protein [Deltaproteobacteria bacterium]|jgi:enoyl-CoA hydratase/carnithine racemase